MKTTASGQARSTLELVMFSVIFCALSTLLQATVVAGEKQFVTWAAGKAVYFESLDVQDVLPEDFSFLDKALEGKRIIYIAESDHWVNQKYDYRLTLIRHLFNRGWRRIGMEMDFCDGKRVDRYLDTGDPSHLERVALYGYKGGWREDRDDIPQGFPGIRAPKFRKAFVSQERRFLRQLRSLSESRRKGTPRLSWFGFDVGLMPCVAYEDAQEILANHASNPAIQEVLKRLRRVEAESRDAEAQRLVGLLGFIETESSSIQKTVGKDRAEDLVRTLQHQVDYLLFADAAKEGASTLNWYHGLVRREQRMASLVDEILADLKPGEKIILMGQVLHLSKNSEGITLGPIGASAPSMWVSIGTHLARKFPGEVYSVWMMYDHGRHGSVLLPDGVEEVPSDSTSVEHLLAQVGETFFLPLKSGGDGESYLREKRHFRQNGSVASGVIAEQADALFFIREVTELVEE
ncbi:MAG: erythromycin esterase family protein [Candidatus Eisenbacteria bacterium]|nr:erythromycin esterase family protein [Candidatus Eisenbacteria bacterium]